MLLKLAFVLALAIRINACDFDWPEAPPMATANFVQVYVALLQATTSDSLAPATADSVLHAHGVTRQQFEAAARYYSEEAERWGEVLKLVVAQLDSQLTKETQATQRRFAK